MSFISHILRCSYGNLLIFQMLPISWGNFPSCPSIWPRSCSTASNINAQQLSPKPATVPVAATDQRHTESVMAFTRLTRKPWARTGEMFGLKGGICWIQEWWVSLIMAIVIVSHCNDWNVRTSLHTPAYGTSSEPYDVMHDPAWPYQNVQLPKQLQYEKCHGKSWGTAAGTAYYSVSCFWKRGKWNSIAAAICCNPSSWSFAKGGALWSPGHGSYEFLTLEMSCWRWGCSLAYQQWKAPGEVALRPAAFHANLEFICSQMNMINLLNYSDPSPLFWPCVFYVLFWGYNLPNATTYYLTYPKTPRLVLFNFRFSLFLMNF